MTVTRDVVYDLLPAYFAGDASADSRALVDEHLRTDPEFAAMADRFRRLLAQATATPHRADPAGGEEARTLARARTAARRGAEFRGLTIGYALATAALAVAGLAGFGEWRAFVIAAAFALTSVLCGAGWYLAERRPEWIERWSASGYF
jgi:anti-sigma factor RsiW